ncbi:unnamed protein product [Schistosoma turkestanicum]|nr:unnamed protein product [Schistosoma turkestanicum]
MDDEFNKTELQFSTENNKSNHQLTTDITPFSISINDPSAGLNATNIPSTSSSSSSSSSIPPPSSSCSTTTTPTTLTTSSRIKNQYTVNNSNNTNTSRNRRQDWCKWPICLQYRTTGYCIGYNNANGILPESSQLCQAAHIGPNDQVPLSSDGQVRVCFDSMGLVNLTCNRSDCYFYHPPKLIRDKIVAKRHAQYLREKVIRDASKSRKSIGGLLTTIEENRNFEKIPNHPPLKLPQPYIGTLNKDNNLQSLLPDCYVDSMQLTNPVVCHPQQQQQPQHLNPPTSSTSSLQQQRQQQELSQTIINHPSHSCLIPNPITSNLSNILVNNLLYPIQPPNLNPSNLFLSTPSCSIFNNNPIKSPHFYSDQNLFPNTLNQMDYEKLYQLILLNCTSLPQPIYSSNLTTPWSKLLDTLIIQNPSLFLTNLPHPTTTTIPVNSNVNYLTPHCIEQILPLNYLMNVSYPLTINNTIQTTAMPFNQNTELLLQHTGLLNNTMENQSINLPSSMHSQSSTISSSTSSCSAAAAVAAATMLSNNNNTPINPEILLRNSQQFLLPTETMNLSINTTVQSVDLSTMSTGSSAILSTTTTTTTTPTTTTATTDKMIIS